MVSWRISTFSRKGNPNNANPNGVPAVKQKLYRGTVDK